MTSHKKNLLITGGAGFIGSNFINYIHKKYPNYNIQLLDALTYAGNLENISNNLYLELFTQYGFNDFLLMKQRKLFGSGFRYKVLEQKKMNGFLGVGVMKEEEQYDLESNENKSLVRSTNYFTWQIQISDNASLENTAYYQLDISRSSDNRLLYDGDLNVELNDKLTITLTLNYRHDSEPHGSLGKSYIQLKNGVEFTF